MKFESIIPNKDLSIHDNPPGLWSRVAIICRWKDAHVFRKRWPHAALVGPLRTLRGIDELIRNLLHNPQIRCLILDGNDLTPDEETTKALLDTWSGKLQVAEDLRGPSWDILVETKIVDKSMFPQADNDIVESVFAVLGLEDVDRQEGKRITLPPPPPKAEAPAPHGDPGERVAADTLAELWPMVLHRAMRFGRVVPTQYGDTRELMDLVAVIRNPLASIEDFEETQNFMGLTNQKAEAYYERVTGKEPPDDSVYSYGSRLAGTPDKSGEKK